MVRQLYKDLNQPVTKVRIESDGWGIRKMMSHYIRRWKSPGRSPET